MAVRKRYKLFLSGNPFADDQPDECIEIEDLTGVVAGPNGYDMMVRGLPSEDGDEMMLRLTREELAELAAICRVLLGHPSGEDIVLAEGSHVLEN